MNYQDIFVENLIRYMNLREKKATDISKDLNIPKTTISSWMTKRRYPKMNTIEAIADYLGIEKSDLTERKIIDNKIIDSDKYTFIPDPISAGVPESIEARKTFPQVEIPDFLIGKLAGNKNIVVMRVNGESMNKIIPSGSFVFVKILDSVDNLKNGDIVVFGERHNYGLKHFIDAGNKIIFRPDSYDLRFADIICTKNEEVEIIGKVISYCVKVCD